MANLSIEDFRIFQEAVVAYLIELDGRTVELERRARVAPQEVGQLRSLIGASGVAVGALQAASTKTNEAVAVLRTDFAEAARGNVALTATLNAEIVRIGGIKTQLDALQEQFGRSQTDALFLSNIAYGYALMATQWKLSRERVRAVVSVPTTGQFLISVSAQSFVFALKVGLSMASSGGSTAFFNAFSGPIGELVKALPAVANNFNDDQIKDIAKDTFMPAISALPGLVADGAGDGMASTFNRMMDPGGAAAAAADALMDPYTFFMDCETKLRRTAMQLNNNRMLGSGSDAYRTQVQSSFGQAKEAMGLDALQADPFWGFLFAPTSDAESQAKWGAITAILGAQMRRLAWRLYCRSQWGNSTYDYTVQPNPSYRELTRPAFAPAPVAPAVWTGEEWKEEAEMSYMHYKAWDSNWGWPAHWGEICADFKGSEHFPDHPAHRGDAAAIALAQKAQTRMTWISMAVVQCCQLKRSTGRVTSTTIDLEKNIHVSGGAVDDTIDGSDASTITQYSTPKELLFDTDLTKMTDTFRVLNATGVDQITITEVRFGKSKAGTWGTGSVSGKKGILTTPNTLDDPLRPCLPGSIRASVSLSSTCITTYDARVYLVKLSATPGGAAPSDITRAPSGIPTGGVAVRKLEEVAFQVKHTRSINVDISDGPGRYCITLDGRVDLRKSAMKFYSEAGWYFDIL